MEISFTIHDAIKPALAKLATEVQRSDIMEAAGLALMSLTRRTFSESSLRPAPWPSRKSGGSHELLKKSGTLWRSIRVANVSPTSVSVVSDRVYAAIHQFGGVIRPKAGGYLKFKTPNGWVNTKQVTIPARPFFPVIGGQFTEDAERRIGKVIELKLEGFAARL